MTATTIKVSRELRDRINHDAEDRGLTAAALLAELVDEYERAQRFAAVRRAYSSLSVDGDEATESALWEATLADGLADA
ncbi:hypothetical protein [Sinomonas sp. G460-2]|uniref:hypothetical protein n=1 Tax=Sinomonas sp. G460-2 TaxID=3393464 RepID=UPI0039EF4BE2